MRTQTLQPRAPKRDKQEIRPFKKRGAGSVNDPTIPDEDMEQWDKMSVSGEQEEDGSRVKNVSRNTTGAGVVCIE